VSGDESRVSVVVLAALDLEARAFAPLAEDWTPMGRGERPHFVGTIGERRVAVLPMAGMGNVNAAIATREAVAVWNPELLLLAGIAGGFDTDDAQYGDVLVPEQVVGYEQGKIVDGETRARYQAFRASSKFLRTCHFLTSTKWFTDIPEAPPVKDESARPPDVRFGVVASGEKVIADKEWGENLRHVWPKAIGVEMEGIGFAQAAYDREVPFGVIKAISDFADRKKSDNWQPYAASVAATFVATVIRALGPPGDEPPPQPQVKDSPLSADAPLVIQGDWGDKKVALCRAMSDHEADDLVDFFLVPEYEARYFGNVRTICKDLWMWLERRRKLSELPFMLEYKLGRPDLAELIVDVCEPH